jgi:hypothetical protein
MTHFQEDVALIEAGTPMCSGLEAILPVNERVGSGYRIARVREDALRAALVVKGYREMTAPDGKSCAPMAPGTFYFHRKNVTIAYLPGIYPHHALAVDEGGGVTSVLVTGRSNREGTTVRELAAALAKAGAVHAILLDNGGDVGLLRRKTARGRLAFEARPAEADRARSWPLRACLIWHAAKKHTR